MTARVVRRAIAVLRLPTQVPALISVVEAIIHALTGNRAIPSPVPSLDVLRTALEALVAAQVVAQSRGKGAAEARNQKLRALVALLELLRANVQNVADGDWENAAGIIESAGMHVKRVGTRVQREFVAKHGIVSGSMILVAPAAAKRAAYDWGVSADGRKTWQELPTTLQSETHLAGLQPGAEYWFRYRAVTKDGEGDWKQIGPVMAR